MNDDNTTFENLTPHTIRVQLAGDLLEIPASGAVVRVSTSTAVVGTLARVPTQRTTFGGVEGLPAPKAGVTYIVSGLVLGQVVGRTDVVAPATGPRDGVVRDDAGRIFAVTRFNLPA